MYTTENTVRGIPLPDKEGRHNAEAIVPVVAPSQKFVAIDYDASENYIYFSEVRKDIIYRIHPDGSGNVHSVSSVISCFVVCDR